MQRAKALRLPLPPFSVVVPASQAGAAGRRRRSLAVRSRAGGRVVMFFNVLLPFMYVISCYVMLYITL
ncbi:hypothetical protein NDU88_004036 [Pleurodeles waltl]|uniref:Uncharacterized protein n=1 Tax=Pleurodeles waltl TaxID=8319 RepID=A0AAV7SHS0_PLEWA|nr:hypothetical protein NDU88_004036 [Pleurodeles waltl]